MIPSNTTDRARLARSRHLVPRLRAAAASAGLPLDGFVAGLPPDEARQAAELVEYDDYLKAKDEAAKAEAKAGDAARLEAAHTELQEKHVDLERRYEALQRQRDALFRRMHSMDGKERGKGRKAPS